MEVRMLPPLFLVSACVLLFSPQTSWVQGTLLHDVRRLGSYNASTENGYGRSPDPNISMSEHCGNWQNEYIQLHKSIKEKSIGDRERRIIMYECNHVRQCGGLGDQLIGIMTSFLIALITDRAFEIGYPAFSSVFSPGAIDWVYNGELAGANCKYISFEEMHRVRYLNLTSSDDNINTVVCINLMQASRWSFRINFEPFIAFIRNYRTVILRANHGFSTFLLRSKTFGPLLRKKGFTIENTPGCLFHFLLRMNASAVKSESVKTIEQSLTAPGVFSVCIHIRPIQHHRADDSLFAKSNPDESLLKDVGFVLQCAERITNYFAKPEQNIKWFVMSSSPWLKTKISEIYPDRVTKTSVKPRHVAYMGKKMLVDALKDTVKEWYLFSKCNKHVMISSGLSKTSVVYSLNYNSSFVFPHDIFSQNTTLLDSSLLDRYCNMTNPTTISDMAVEWSCL